MGFGYLIPGSGAAALAQCASLTPLEESGVEGVMVATTTDSAAASVVVVFGSLVGLEASIEGTIAIQETCENGGAATTLFSYASDAVGFSSVNGTAEAPDYYLGAALVALAADGTPVACGTLDDCIYAVMDVFPGVLASEAAALDGADANGYAHVSNLEALDGIRIALEFDGGDGDARVYVDNATSCDATTGPLGGDDAWSNATFSFAESSLDLYVQGDTSLEDVAGRVVVVEAAADGLVLACGALHGVKGTTAIWETEEAGGIRIRAVIGGFEPYLTDGFHVHEGFSCVGAGGHYVGDLTYDPWDTTIFQANRYGVTIVDENISEFSIEGGDLPVQGHTIVLHHEGSGRLACGVLSLFSESSVAV